MTGDRVVDNWVNACLDDAISEDSRPWTWFELVEALLLGCLDNQEAYSQALPSDGHSLSNIRDDVFAEIGAKLLKHNSGLISARLIEDLQAVVGDHVGRLEDQAEAELVAIGAGAADAIDEVFHTKFVPRLRESGEQQLRPRRAHYVHRYDPRDPHPLYDGPVTTDPVKLIRGELGQTAHVRISGPEAATHRYIMDWDAYGRLSPLAEIERLRIAVCEPNVSISEFDVTTRVGPDGRESLFANHGPSADLDETAKLLVRQLKQAMKADADVVLFPEYTVPLAARHALTQALETAARDGERVPVMVVAGTAAVDHGNGEENELCVLFPTGKPVLLAKVHPAVVGDLKEDILASWEIRVLMTRRFALAIPICLDAMQPAIVQQLGNMGVNICLVPAMSPKTGNIVQEACSLAVRSQAIVAFGNAPAFWPGKDHRVLAAFHTPHERHPEVALLPLPDERPFKKRGIWVFDVYAHEWTWEETSS